MDQATQNIPDHVPASRVVDFDIYDVPLHQGDYHLGLKQLHNPGIPDIFWTPRHGGHWIATRGDDIYHIFKDYQSFSSSNLQPMYRNDTSVRMPPIMYDPPEHTGYRSLITPVLTPKAVENLLTEMGAEMHHAGSGALRVTLNGAQDSVHLGSHSLAGDQVMRLRKLIQAAGVEPERDFPL